MVKASSTMVEAPERPSWSRATTISLIAIGVALAAFAFAVVLSMPSLAWHPARDAELQATYQAYRDTGVPLVKVNGTGSNMIPVVGTQEYGPAAWDDDPGVYLVALAMSHVTGSASPYPGLKAVMALLCAAPLVVLPLAVARLFRSKWAGYATGLLPLVTWLANGRTFLVGTEYGLSDAISTLPVYALYGIAAAMVFASLTLLLLLASARLGTRGLVIATVAVGLLAGVGNLMRSMSGVGVALAVGLLWWLKVRRPHRWAWAAGGAVVALVLAFLVPNVTMRVVDAERSHLTGIPAAELPTSHMIWHTAYLGLSYPTPMNGEPSAFPVEWSDAFGWEQARKVEPDVAIASVEYDRVMKGLYFDQVRAMPVEAVRLYAEKTLFTLGQFMAMLAIAVAGLALALWRMGGSRGRVGGGFALAVPALLIGLVPPVLAMPLLYYFSELSASIGLLVAIGLGAIATVVASLASRARGTEQVATESVADEPAAPAVPGAPNVL